MASKNRQRPSNTVPSERERELLLERPQLKEAGVLDLMRVYEKIEEVYARAHHDPPPPATSYSASSNP